MGRVNKERLAAARKRRRKVYSTWSFIILALLALGLLLYGLLPKPDPRLPLAKCLTAHGAVMYGSDASEAVQEQKRRFGPAFAAVRYVNCAYSTACRDEGVSVSPTWMVGGERLTGVQPLALLAEKSNCSEEEP